MRRTRRSAIRAALAAVATLTAVAGCTSSKGTGPADPSSEETTVTTPTIPAGSTGTAGGPACDFVPLDALSAVLGTDQFTATGSLTGTGPARTGACSVVLPDNDAPAVQILLGPGSTALAGASATSVEAKAAEHPGGWYIYPNTDGVGWAHPQYESTVNGTKVTGALTYLVRGDAVVGVRLLRPRPGRDAVPDSVSLALAVAQDLGLPVAAGSGTSSP